MARKSASRTSRVFFIRSSVSRSKSLIMLSSGEEDQKESKNQKNQRIRRIKESQEAREQ
jgi:hypothetical protein